MKVKILTEKELRQVVGVSDAAISAIEEAFSNLAAEKALMPPVMHIENGDNQGGIDMGLTGN